MALQAKYKCKVARLPVLAVVKRIGRSDGMTVWKGTPRTVISNAFVSSTDPVAKIKGKLNLCYFRVKALIRLRLKKRYPNFSGTDACFDKELQDKIKLETMKEVEETMEATQTRLNRTARRGFRKWHSYLPEAGPLQDQQDVGKPVVQKTVFTSSSTTVSKLPLPSLSFTKDVQNVVTKATAATAKVAKQAVGSLEGLKFGFPKRSKVQGRNDRIVFIIISFNVVLLLRCLCSPHSSAIESMCGCE